MTYRQSAADPLEFKSDLASALARSKSLAEFRHEFLSSVAIKRFYQRGLNHKHSIYFHMVVDVLKKGNIRDYLRDMLESCLCTCSGEEKNLERIKNVIESERFLKSVGYDFFEKELSLAKTPHDKVGVVQKLILLWRDRLGLSEEHVHHNTVKAWMDLYRTHYALEDIRHVNTPLIDSSGLSGVFSSLIKDFGKFDVGYAFRGASFLGNAAYPISYHKKGLNSSKKRNINILGASPAAVIGNIWNDARNDQRFKIRAKNVFVKYYQNERESLNMHRAGAKVLPELSRTNDARYLICSPVCGSPFDLFSTAWALDAPSGKKETDKTMVMAPMAVYRHYLLSLDEKDFDKEKIAKVFDTSTDDFITVEEKARKDTIAIHELQCLLDPDHFFRLHKTTRTTQGCGNMLSSNPWALMDSMLNHNFKDVKMAIPLADPVVIQEAANIQTVYFDTLNIDVTVNSPIELNHLLEKSRELNRIDFQSIDIHPDDIIDGPL